LSPLKGFQGSFLPVVFTSDSRGFADREVDPLSRLWDVADGSKERPPARIQLSDGELQDLWSYLASEDAPLGLEAAETLALDPKRAIAFRHNQPKPDPPSPPPAQLIADLDHDRFAVRQKATQQLLRLGKGAEPALRDLLKKRPSLEVTRRVEELL